MDETEGGLQLVASGSGADPCLSDAGTRSSSSSDSAGSGALLGLLSLQAAAFALAGASGKIPAAVITLFRALLTF
ncbi:MAG TPA: hypothetical protein VL084_09400 [Thermoanaerobaculia bacterium]|nr:hypothetical protein [Thermoanaerobaculia bacterium]